MSDARTLEEALAELKGVPLDAYRAQAAAKKKIRERGIQFRKLPPTSWPPLIFNWDLSETSQHYVYDGVDPSGFAKSHPEGLRLGYVDVAEFDRALCHFNRRADLVELWKCGDYRKLCYALAHLEAGLPMTPPFVSVANGKLCFAGGNHRYTAAKFSGQTCIPIYVKHEDVSSVERLVRVQWAGT